MKTPNQWMATLRTWHGSHYLNVTHEIILGIQMDALEPVQTQTNDSSAINDYLSYRIDDCAPPFEWFETIKRTPNKRGLTFSVSIVAAIQRDCLTALCTTYPHADIINQILTERRKLTHAAIGKCCCGKPAIMRKMGTGICQRCYDIENRMDRRDEKKHTGMRSELKKYCDCYTISQKSLSSPIDG